MACAVDRWPALGLTVGLLAAVGVTACASSAPVADRYRWTPMGDALAANEAAAGATAVAPASADTADANWPDGPIAVIATDQERAAFVSPGTEAERAQLLDAFWQRRDKTPGDGVNESRQEFDRRAAVAATFGASESPGWRTSFGMTLLVIGFPYSVTLARDGFEETRNASLAAPDLADSGDRVVWHYAPADLAQDYEAVPIAYDITFYYLADQWRMACEPVSWTGPRIVGGTVTGTAPTTPPSSYGSSSASSTDDTGAGSLGVAPDVGGISDGSAPHVYRWWTGLMVPPLGRGGGGCDGIWLNALRAWSGN